jgi:hypothetical protein
MTKTTSGADGRFEFTNVSPGQYVATAAAPALVDESARSAGRPGRDVSVGLGETVEGVDLSLVRGGVVTGRVTDEDGRPVVRQLVTATPVDEHSPGAAIRVPWVDAFATDDRGVYRIFGLAPGRYLVSVGGGTGARVSRTYAPGVRDASASTVVEIALGGEVRNVDIALGQPEQRHAIAGRVVNAATGAPVAGIALAYGPFGSGEGYRLGAMSEETGHYRIDGLTPGRYVLFANPGKGPADWYSDTVTVDVPRNDRSEIEIALVPAATISGTVVVEGSPSAAGRYPRLGAFTAQSSPRAVLQPPPPLIAVEPDGTFRATGLRPGLVKFYVADAEAQEGAAIARVEREGIEQPAGIEIGASEHVAGVRIVLASGVGGVHGRVEIQGGDLPQGTGLVVTLRRVGTDAAVAVRHVPVDPRGAFSADRLVPGEYELTVRAFATRGRPVLLDQRRSRRSVAVTDGNIARVTLVVELARGDEQ